MAQNFSMTAEYGQHNGKIGSAAAPTTKQPEENYVETEVKNFEYKHRTRKKRQHRSLGLLQHRRQVSNEQLDN
jgi:hypothetical protein